MIKVSIIVPIYNAMKVLNKTIENILNQTYQNIEVLLIDNNSKDGSLQYINELEKKDHRIKVISEKKQGPNYARKTGLLNASGDYIMFCDSDDYMKLDAVEKFVNEINESNADVVVGNYIEITPRREFLKEKKGIFLKDKRENLKDKKEILFIKPALWNKIFKRDIIHEEFFVDSTIGEDMVISLLSIMTAQRIKYIDKDIYEYVPNEEGLSNSVSAKNILDIIKTVELLKKVSKENQLYANYKDEIEFIIFTHIIYKTLRTVMMKEYKERKQVYNKLVDYLKTNKQYKNNKYYKKSIHYRIANLILSTKWIYNLKTTQFLLKQIFINKTIFNIFKKLDV